jgi:hypothetical protein
VQSKSKERHLLKAKTTSHHFLLGHRHSSSTDMNQPIQV